ncbi:MAG: hypothetical protein V9G24_11995 [Rhodoblastus sp.]
MVAAEAFDALRDIGEFDARQMLDRQRRHVEPVRRQGDADDGPFRITVGADFACGRTGDVRRIGEIADQRLGDGVRVGGGGGEDEHQSGRHAAALLGMESQRLLAVDVRPDAAARAAGVGPRNRSRQLRLLVASSSCFPR